MNKILGVLITVIILSALGSVIYLRVAVIKPALECIQTELITPYIQLQDQGNIEVAYQRYTSDNYRKEHSLEDIREWHNKVNSELGQRLSFEMVREHSPLLESKGSSYQLHYRMQYEEGNELMAFEIVPTEDGYKIDRAHTQGQSGGLKPSPW